MNLSTRPVLVALILAVAACTGTDANKNGADVTDLTSAAYSLPPAASVEVAPNASRLAVGATIKLASNVYDSSGHRLTGALVASLARWESSDTTVAKVSATGVVTAVHDGKAVISAIADRQTATSMITVGTGQSAVATDSSVSIPTTPARAAANTTSQTPATDPAPASTPVAAAPVTTQPPAATAPATVTPPATTATASTETATSPVATEPTAPPPPTATEPPAATAPVATTTATTPPTATLPPLVAPTPPPTSTVPDATAPIASDPVVAEAPVTSQTPVVTQPISTPPSSSTGPGLSGLALVSDDFTRYSSTADLLHNITVTAGGTAAVHAGLYDGGVNAQLVQLDSTVRYNDHPTMKFNQPGGVASTPQLRVFFPSTTHIWYRVKVRFSPGFTTAGTLTNSSNAYKLLSWGWSTPWGSGRIEITNTTEYQLYENVQLPPTSVLGGGGAYLHAGQITTEWSDAGWYDYIVEVDHSQPAGVIRLWRSKDGQTPVYKGEAAETMKDGSMMPPLSTITVGLNFNQVRVVGKDQALWWGEWEVVDGNQHPNPFGVSR